MLHLFVYGSLQPGQENAHYLEKIKGQWQAAHMFGHLFKDGWGDYPDYPGLIIDPTAERIEGYLLSSDDLADHWAELDAFEGPEYKRTLTDVTTDTGDTVQAYLYAIRNPEEALTLLQD
ncbi:gamma-glutamylcyclotransferase [Terasakiella pusilla]|uniref:gamma-glutamylcyclotransferase n=1 Tax=Terasakiella pusilla TaxID=64973 RepID=UPI003AA802FE